MSLIPPDKYRFRRVLCNVLMLPCMAVWFYVLLFCVSSPLVLTVLAIVLGFGTAYGIATVIYLIGHAAVDEVDKRVGRDDP